jgi:hypothetical protein
LFRVEIITHLTQKKHKRGTRGAEIDVNSLFLRIPFWSCQIENSRITKPMYRFDLFLTPEISFISMTLSTMPPKFHSDLLLVDPHFLNKPVDISKTNIQLSFFDILR